MTISKVIAILEELAPLGDAEGFDNVGLLVGDASAEARGVLITLDTLENVVDEALAKDCNLIVSFHPIIFSGLKKITGRNYVERVVLKAIKNDIAIYSMHTALDNSPNGVNAKISEVLGLIKTKMLIPKKGGLKQLTSYIPIDHTEQVKNALFAAGAGRVGNYSECSFNIAGTGNYKAMTGAQPYSGSVGSRHHEKEDRLSLIYESALEGKVLSALLNAHPYEEVAYEILALDNEHPVKGMGMVGELPEAMDGRLFLNYLKERMNAEVVRHSQLLDRPIQRVAVLGGSGAFAIGAAIKAKADILVTADVKYHQFYEAEGQLVIADIGHFETEQFTKNLLVDYLTKKIPNFAIHLSESITNPIKYF